MNSKWVLVSAILASSMAFIDSSALNAAIPSIQSSLDATGQEMLWILNGYLLMLAALIMVGGSLGDKLGRKRIFMLGIIIFMGASLLCGIAPNSVSLIVARIVQGLGGALMIPGSLALISASFEDSKRGEAIGSWSAITTMVTLGGPILGGFLADQGWWRWIFLINIPLGIVALFILKTKVMESRNEQETSSIDYWGAGLIILGLASLTYGFLTAPDSGWHHPLIISSLIVGVLSLLGFVWAEAKSRHPLMPLHLFQCSTFSGANLLTLFLYGALSAGFLFLTFYMVQFQGYSQTLAGLAVTPFAILLAGLSRSVGKLADRFGPKWFLVAGPFLAGAGFLLLSLVGKTDGPSSYWTTFFPGILCFGLGMAVTVAPLTTTVMGSAGQEYSGTASGINNAVSRTAGVLAIAIMGAVALSSFQSHLQEHTRSFALPKQAREALWIEAGKLGEAAVPPSVPIHLKPLVKEAMDLSFQETYHLVLILCAVLSGISALIAVVLIRNREVKTEALGQAAAM